MLLASYFILLVSLTGTGVIRRSIADEVRIIGFLELCLNLDSCNLLVDPVHCLNGKALAKIDQLGRAKGRIFLKLLQTNEGLKKRGFRDLGNSLLIAQPESFLDQQ